MTAVSASSSEPVDSSPSKPRGDGFPQGLDYYGNRDPWSLVSLSELWVSRDLCWMLGLRDLQVRYRQTLVGIAWALLQPLASMAIFVTLFRLLDREPSSPDVPYALVLLCGLIPWQFFASIVSGATNSLVAHQSMIGKVYFPRLILPLATLIPAGVDFGIACGLILLAFAWFQQMPGWALLALPLLSLLIAVAGLALGIWLAALNAMYRDIGFVVPFALQIGFFVTPVIYQAEILIPVRWRTLYWLNPMAGLVEGVRWCLLPGRPFPGIPLLASVAVTAVVLVTGLAYFRRVERFVADCI